MKTDPLLTFMNSLETELQYFEEQTLDWLLKKML